MELNQIEKLKELKKLVEEGILTQDEFDHEKRNLLGIGPQKHQGLIKLRAFYSSFRDKFFLSIKKGRSFLNIMSKNVKEYFKQILSIIIENKRIFIGIAAFVLVIFIVINTITHYQKVAAEKAAIEQAIEQARIDSINAAERAEQERIAAAKRAEEARIAAIEQARLDSIDKAEHKGFVAKMANIGLIITNVGMIEGHDKDGDITKGVKYTIFNPTKKRIKYVIAVVKAVNSVGDVTSGERRCRGIGPIESHEYGTWSFDDVFYDKNDIIDDLRGYFIVVFSNGSSKTVRIKDALVDFEEHWFE